MHTFLFCSDCHHTVSVDCLMLEHGIEYVSVRVVSRCPDRTPQIPLITGTSSCQQIKKSAAKVVILHPSSSILIPLFIVYYSSSALCQARLLFYHLTNLCEPTKLEDCAVYAGSTPLCRWLFSTLPPRSSKYLDHRITPAFPPSRGTRSHHHKRATRTIRCRRLPFTNSPSPLGLPLDQDRDTHSLVSI